MVTDRFTSEAAGVPEGARISAIHKAAGRKIFVIRFIINENSSFLLFKKVYHKPGHLTNHWGEKLPATRLAAVLF
jgi:hypothetical protein